MTHRPGYRRLASGLLYLSITSVCALYFTELHFTLNQESGWGTLADLVKGTALTPFQYRVLIPWLVWGLLRLPMLQVVPMLAWFKFFEFASVTGLTLALRHFLSFFIRGKTLPALLSLSVFYVLPFHYIFPRSISWIYPSDLPAVLFFTLGLICLYRQDWKAYYPVFVVATLNRETTCFLTLLYVFTAIGRDSRRSLVLHSLAQAAIWVAVKVGLYWLYQHNPGFGVFEDQLLRNVSTLTTFSNLVTLLGMWGFTWIPVLIWFRLIRDAFVRRSLLMLIPFLLGMSTVGVVYEMRIYAEPIPLILTAFWLIVERLWLGEDSRLVAQEPVPISDPISVTRSSGAGRFRLTTAWLIFGVLWLNLGLIAAFVWYEQKANLPVEHVSASLRDSLQNTLAPAGPDEHIVVVNWPSNIRASPPARLLGILPFSLTLVRPEWPANLAPNAVRLQYFPWQGGASGLGIDFMGTQVTQPELAEQVRQADRVIDFHAGSVQMYTLAQRLPGGELRPCRAKFGRGVCLAEAWLTQFSAELRLDLVWRVERSPAPETTVFVHVFDAQAGLVAQADGDPVRNLLPLASWPGPNYVLREARWAARPTGDYQVRVGVYNRISGERLEATCTWPNVCSADGLVLGAGIQMP